MRFEKRGSSLRFSIQNSNIRLMLICFLCSFYGCVLVFSAIYSADMSMKSFMMQAGASLLGLIIAILISPLNYEDLCDRWYIFAIAAVVPVLLTFTPLGINVSGTDDTAWLGFSIGSLSFTFQPAEFMKIAFIISFSKHLSMVQGEVSRLRNVLLLGIHASIPVGLVFLQGDDGTALVFILMFISMMFAAGLKWQYFAGTFGLLATSLPFLWFNMSEEKQGRILAILNPEPFLETYGWQQHEGLVVMGSGKLTGVGFLQGSNPNLFARHNDLIFTVAAEEFGYIGSLILLALLSLLIIELWRSASKAKDPLGSYICIGALAMFGFQSIINIGMNLRLLPIIGITLPFFSAGGTSSLTLYLAIGLVLSVCFHSNIKNSSMRR